jgi:phosphoribosylformylglycinamidine synthase
VGTLGLVDQLERSAPGVRLVAGSHILLVGTEADTSLAGSRWAVDLHGHRGGRLPALDLGRHAQLLTLVAELAGAAAAGEDVRLVDGVHDVSDGGVGVALAEMAVRGEVGFQVGGIPDHHALFGEGPSRVVLSVPAASLAAVEARAAAAGIRWARLGRAGGDRLVIDGLLDLSLTDAVQAWRGALPQRLGVLAGDAPTPV